MRRRGHLIAGVLCGVLCVAGILSYTSDVRSDFEQERAEAFSRYGGEQVEILVATDDVAAGDMLDSTNSEKRLWLSELIPDGALADASDVAGIPATSPIYAGEVVLKHRFDERETVALQVPDGKCAVSVPAKAVSAVGGSVGPGSYVDVYASSGSATDLMASRVLVLSTSATAEEDGEKKSDMAWVTLAVEPAAVEEFITASQKSELYFVLPADENDLPDFEKEGGSEGDEPISSDGEKALSGGFSQEATADAGSSRVRNGESAARTGGANADTADAGMPDEASAAANMPDADAVDADGA